ncbi:MAG: NADPH-dependent 7-cyano-7-deazaguanine reductase QueF [Ignavibacteriae bacterium]|nr:NADPH-dependent 7-cyano-7-deazaguanine reductase QueF [Ignavibacteriota bacterium]
MSKKQLTKNQPQPLDKRFDFDDTSKIDAGVLDTFPYEYAGNDIVINIETDEFTAVCPWSGLPDFAVITVNYIPKKDCIELRSFKYYLLSYRNVGIYQEHAVNRILQDLVRCCKPKWMEVIADYNVRGGVHTVTTVEWGKK